jgi:hypothetical protein
LSGSGTDMPSSCVSSETRARGQRGAGTSGRAAVPRGTRDVVHDRDLGGQRARRKRRDREAREGRLREGVAIVSGERPRGGETQGRSGRGSHVTVCPLGNASLPGQKAQKATLLRWRSFAVRQERGMSGGQRSAEKRIGSARGEASEGRSLGALSRRNKRDCAALALIRHVGSQTQEAAPSGAGVPGTPGGEHRRTR